MQENLAIAFVPVQDWGALYEAEKALCVGTVFQDLNKPFFAAADEGTDNYHCDSAESSQQQERERMMARIQATSFVLDDVRLYLDTHPDDRQGLTLLNETLAERKKLLLAYTERFYPLTVDSMADFYEKDPAPECYCWQKGPMPWEGACV